MCQFQVRVLSFSEAEKRTFIVSLHGSKGTRSSTTGTKESYRSIIRRLLVHTIQNPLHAAEPLKTIYGPARPHALGDRSPGHPLLINIC